MERWHETMRRLAGRIVVVVVLAGQAARLMAGDTTHAFLRRAAPEHWLLRRRTGLSGNVVRGSRTRGRRFGRCSITSWALHWPSVPRRCRSKTAKSNTPRPGGICSNFWTPIPSIRWSLAPGWCWRPYRSIAAGSDPCRPGQPACGRPTNSGCSGKTPARLFREAQASLRAVDVQLAC